MTLPVNGKGEKTRITPMSSFARGIELVEVYSFRFGNCSREPVGEWAKREDALANFTCLALQHSYPCKIFRTLQQCCSRVLSKVLKG
jgi:hypothetical protein